MTTGRAGDPVHRVDAVDKVTGRAEFAIDTQMPGQLYGDVLRSTRGHAEIESIETSAAEAASGVVAIVTAENLEGLFPRFGHIVADHAILAIDKVRFYGEPVALVVGTSPHAASDGADLIRVSYRDLPVVTDAAEALEPDAPLIHETDYVAGDRSFAEAQSAGDRSNLAHEATLDWGDVESALDEADVLVTTKTRYPMLYAYAMEPYNAVARFESDSLEVVSTSQHPYQVREDLARIFSMRTNQVRVRSPFLGGGYGSKSYTKLEPLAAVGAWCTGRPVKVTTDVEGAIHTTRADSAVVEVTSGFASDGTLIVRDFDILMNTGAYADNGPLVLTKSVNRCFGPYRIPNLRVRGRTVYTNTVPSSSYRGFGAPQGNLTGELNMDQAAEELGLDAHELRLKNLVRPGERHIPGKRGVDADLGADLDVVADTLEWSGISPPGLGTGFGCSASDAGAYPVSTAEVRIHADGSVVVLSGSTEMGQGSRTALAQIAASELEVPVDRVRVVQSDTFFTPYERTTGASRTTTLTGLAVQRACRDALAKLVEAAAEIFDCTTEEVKVAEGVAVGPTGKRPIDELIQAWFGGRQGEITGVGVVRRAGDLKELPPFWEIGMVGVTVSVDPDTGVVTVEHLVTVGDVGYAINPALVEGQDLGAATQGLGAALSEELVYDGPQIANPNIVEYRVPHASDTPSRIDNIIVERHDGVGPWGAKGGGEGSLNPIGGAVAAAVGRATGHWPSELPLTPERVWRLMQEEPRLR